MASEDEKTVSTEEKEPVESVNEKEDAMPTVEMIEQELEKEQSRHHLRKVIRSTIYVLVLAAAVAVLAAVLLFSTLQITGTSMTETLQDGDVVLTLKKNNYKAGDIVAFYYDNKILVKRVIATAGDRIEIDGEGNVSVNGGLLDEPYVSNKSLGYCDIIFPCQVPEGQNFLMGDCRETSMDSRISEIGCVDDEMIVGKILFCVWPMADFGPAH